VGVGGECAEHFGFVVQLKWMREDMKVAGGGRDSGIRRDRVNGLSGLGGLTTSLVIEEGFQTKTTLNRYLMFEIMYLSCLQEDSSRFLITATTVPTRGIIMLLCNFTSNVP
jgi:hypothetical protein